MQERLLRLPIYVNSSSKNRLKKFFGDQKSDSISNSPLIFFLYKNYRSHKSILEIPSKLFYDGLLEECGDRQTLDRLSQWNLLPSSKGTGGTHFPLLLIGVNGTHQHDQNSPSFYNVKEIEEVVRVCASLTSKVKPKEIGVIAAFRQQVLKLRLALRAANLSNINVGSVEDFQGQEIAVIIISTVLSALPHSFLSRSIRKQTPLLGLIGDRRRFNVAVTRGMSLCVIVGQPDVLYSDSYWRELIEYIDSNGSLLK